MMVVEYGEQVRNSKSETIACKQKLTEVWILLQAILILIGEIRSKQ